MSSEEANDYCAEREAETNRNQTVEEEDIKVDRFLVSSTMKCENEIDEDCKEEAFSSYPIKMEAEDLNCDWHNNMPVEKEDVPLKEEIDIEDHKPGWEPVRGKGGAGTLLAEGGLVVSEDNFNCPSGSKSAELVVKYNNCAHCPYKTNERRCFIGHYNRVHKQCTEVYRCNECPHQTGNIQFMFRMLTFEMFDKVTSKCDECSFETSFTRNLTKYHKIQHAEDTEVYKCAECSYETINKYNFTRHIKIKHTKEGEVYKCDQCSHKTRNKKNFIRHHRIQHSKEVHKCEECSYQTKYKSALTQHFKCKHSKEGEIYKCEECSYQTKYKTALTQHFKRKHSKEGEIYKCEECSYKTRDKGNFTRHHKIKHTKEGEVFKCEECSYETRSKCNFIQHHRNKYHLTRHNTIKHTEVVGVYKCYKCSFVVNTKSDFIKHYKRKHAK